MLSRLNLILVVALAFVLALLMIMRVDNSRPNFQVNLGDDMTASPAYSAYEANENFANGRTLQNPIPGTIARGAKQFHYIATPKDALRAGEQLTNPFDLSAEHGTNSAARGQLAYQKFCVACHAADGAGNGPVARRGFPPPPSLLTGTSRGMKDGQLFHILTYGQNSMPTFAAQLTHDRRWDVINHIRLLQQKTEPTAGQAPTTPPSEAEQETTNAPKATPVNEPILVAPLESNTEPIP